jgi:hypothetical protein
MSVLARINMIGNWRKQHGSVGTIMPTKTRSPKQDRPRVSSQRHEVSYAGKKLGRGGAARVRKAKSQLGRTTSRKKVMSRARSMTSRSG